MCISNFLLFNLLWILFQVVKNYYPIIIYFVCNVCGYNSSLPEIWIHTQRYIFLARSLLLLFHILLLVFWSTHYAYSLQNITWIIFFTIISSILSCLRFVIIIINLFISSFCLFCIFSGIGEIDLNLTVFAFWSASISSLYV